MADSELSISVIWADPDLLEIRTQVQFEGWCGNETAYVAREELTAFADDLERLASGPQSASLQAGQPDLSWITLQSFEYDRARRVGLHIDMGSAADRISNVPSAGTVLRLTVPIERGPLPQFARHLRSITTAERGMATLALLPAWPF
jgi:hypothetical protein